MNEISYVSYMSEEDADRMRVHARTERGRILSFVVQYEAWIKNKWRPIVRYDSAHGFAHKDIHHPHEAAEKQVLNLGDYSNAFTFAIRDIKHQWHIYRRYYEQEF